jgi:hypothetical protein
VGIKLSWLTEGRYNERWFARGTERQKAWREREHIRSRASLGGQNNCITLATRNLNGGRECDDTTGGHQDYLHNLGRHQMKKLLLAAVAVLASMSGIADAQTNYAQDNCHVESRDGYVNVSMLPSVHGKILAQLKNGVSAGTYAEYVDPVTKERWVWIVVYEQVPVLLLAGDNGNVQGWARERSILCGE